MNLLAHQGGWDEVLMFLAIPALFLIFKGLRRVADRRSERERHDPET